MKLSKWLMLLGCFWVLFINHAFASQIDKIIAFGDSLSDNGNIWELTKEARKIVPTSPIIPDDPYYEGRFTNGPVWVENIAKTLDIPLFDYAYGGAWAETFRDSHLLIPFSLHMQVNFFLVRFAHDFHKADHLYTIWIGGNDYINGRKDVEYATSNCIMRIRYAIESLIKYGAKHILILNLPDLSTVPIVKVKALEYGKQLRDISRLHNKKLLTMIKEEQLKFHDANLMHLDVGGMYADASKAIDEKGGDYNGVKNFHDACYNGGYYPGIGFAMDDEIRAAKINNLDINNTPDLKIALLTSRHMWMHHDEDVCSTPNQYFYWDLVHPSKVVHEFLAGLVVAKLRSAHLI